MKEIITYILVFIGLYIFTYFLSRIQMKAWLKVIEQFLNEKYQKSNLKSKENEQKKKE